MRPVPQCHAGIYRAAIILAAARNNVPAVYTLSAFAEEGGRGPRRLASALARLSKRLAHEIKRTTRFLTTSGRKPPWSFPCPSRPAAPGQRVKERTRE